MLRRTVLAVFSLPSPAALSLVPTEVDVVCCVSSCTVSLIKPINNPEGKRVLKSGKSMEEKLRIIGVSRY